MSGFPRTGTATPVRPILPDLQGWRALLNFRPPLSVTARLASQAKQPPQGALFDSDFKFREGYFGGRVVGLDQAYPSAPISLDYYPVGITTLPTVDGKQLTPAELLRYFRLHINEFVDSTNSSFAPIHGDAKLWEGNDPTGAVVTIAITAVTAPVLGAIRDNASVVVAESTADHWIFSTLETVADLGHPVSGNRIFGFTQAADGSLTFFTRGADRTTSLADTLAKNDAFAGANALWVSFQKGLAQFVNRHGGTATVGRVFAERFDWAAVRAQYGEHGLGGAFQFLIPSPPSGRLGRLRTLLRRPVTPGLGQEWQRRSEELSRQEAQRVTRNSIENNQRSGELARSVAERTRLQEALIQQNIAHQVAASAAAHQVAAHEAVARAAAQEASVHQLAAQQAAAREAAARASGALEAARQASLQQAAAQAAAQQAAARQAAEQQRAAQARAQEAAAQQAAARQAEELARQRVRIPVIIMGPPQIIRH